VLATLFLYRDFTTQDVQMAGLSLMAYTCGLPGFMLVRVLTPAFFSRKDTRTPVRIAVVAMLTNITLNLVFVLPMVWLQVPGPHAGLALATSIAAWVNAGLLFRVLYRRQIYRPLAGWRRFFLQLGLAGGALAAILLWAVPALPEWIAWGFGMRALHLLLWIGIGAAAYFLVLRAGGVQFAELWRGAHAVRPDA
jgi:putative peptidoglycan lipid II flippase